MELSLVDIRNYIGDGIRLVLTVMSIVGFLLVIAAVMVNPSSAPNAAVSWLVDELIPWWVGPLASIATVSAVGAVLFLIFIKWIREI